jgi:TrmH family RNA methyltransferase
VFISSTNNKIVKNVTKLHQKKYRRQNRRFLVEGYHMYEEAMKAEIIERIFTTDESIQGSNVIHVTKPVLQKLAKAENPQGVLCECKMIKHHNIGDKVLLLDHIQDPGNLGTLLRSALSFGFETVVLDETVDPYNDKVLRSTQGALFQLNILEQSIMAFIGNNPTHKVIATALEGTLLEQAHVTKPFALILGNEGSGIKAELLNKADLTITIPMVKTESLNVAVAGSIIMYHLR